MNKAAVIITLITILNLFSETIILNNTDIGNQTWNKTESPYIINGRAFVPSNKTLIINPGVVIKFKTGENIDYTGEIDVGFLEIKGKIVADGSPNDTIQFMPKEDNLNWGGVFLYNTMNENIFSYCKISGANRIYNFESESFDGALGLYNSNITINNCIISSNISNGIFFNENSIYLIKNNIFKNNKNGIYIVYSEGLIENNLFIENTTNGIFTYNSDPQIQNNRSFNNVFNGILCSWYSSPKLINNVSADNGRSGIYCEHESHATIINNTLAFNGIEGLKIEQSDPNIKNTIIFGNHFDVNFSGAYNDPIISYSTLEGNYLSDLFQNEGNVMLETDPLFNTQPVGYGLNYNGIEYDYNIQSNSPCKDAGTPDTLGLNLPSIDLIGNDRIINNRVDMGAYECNNNSSIHNNLKKKINLYQNYPNPFNPETEIKFIIPKNYNQNVKLSVFNISGQEISVLLNKPLTSGLHIVGFNATNLPSGIYYYKIEGNGFKEVKKMLLQK